MPLGYLIIPRGITKYEGPKHRDLMTHIDGKPNFDALMEHVKDEDLENPKCGGLFVRFDFIEKGERSTYYANSDNELYRPYDVKYSGVYFRNNMCELFKVYGVPEEVLSDIKIAISEWMEKKKKGEDENS